MFAAWHHLPAVPQEQLPEAADWLQEYFSKFGFVLDVYLPRDKVMRTEHRGFGFVTFETLSALNRINAHDQPHTIK